MILIYYSLALFKALQFQKEFVMPNLKLPTH
nr:MAG TPA: hypothetical protein [Caudoviricetes sp.]